MPSLSSCTANTIVQSSTGRSSAQSSRRTRYLVTQKTIQSISTRSCTFRITLVVFCGLRPSSPALAFFRSPSSATRNVLPAKSFHAVVYRGRRERARARRFPDNPEPSLADVELIEETPSTAHKTNEKHSIVSHTMEIGAGWAPSWATE